MITNEEEKTISFLQKKNQDENYTGDELDEDESGQEDNMLQGSNHQQDLEGDDLDEDYESGNNQTNSPQVNQQPLDSVKEEEEEHQSYEQSKKKELFEKHRLNLYPAAAGYTNFNYKEDIFHDVGEFSWDFQGRDLLSRFLPEVTEAVHGVMGYALQMTNNAYGQKAQNIDTSSFRQYVSGYIQQIYGLRDDQFNYSQINKLIQIAQKIFIKKIGCSPQTTTIQDYMSLSTILTPSEKCHICIIVMETKKMIELLYLSQAVNSYLSQ